MQDCWLIVFDKVFNLTPLVSRRTSEEIMRIIEHAGDDVSVWFDTVTRDVRGCSGHAGWFHAPTSSPSHRAQVRTFVDPVTQRVAPYTPHGRFLHVPAPEGAGGVAVPVPWWRDAALEVGLLTKAPRRLRIVNSLANTEHPILVAGEATVAEIQTFFLECNAHCRSYTWKAFVGGRFITLDPGRTLGDNGVADDTAEAAALGLDPDLPGYQTTLLLVYNDDLTTA